MSISSILFFLILLFFSCSSSCSSSSSSSLSSFSPLSHSSAVCCQQTNAFALYQCIQETTASATATAAATSTETSSKHPRIHLITYLSYDIVPYAAYAIAINLAYATRNGYGFQVLDEFDSNFEPRDQRWNRVKILLNRLDSALKRKSSTENGSGSEMESEYLVWVDADLIFTNHSHILSSYIASHPSADILISAERHAATGVANTGCMIIKVSEWSLQFFRAWWTNYDRVLDHDQIYFNVLYRSMLPSIAERIAILPSHALNSHPPAALYQQSDHYVLHLMGERSDVRSSLFRTGYINLCDNHHHHQNSENSEYNQPGIETTRSRQLGLSKRVLLETTFEIYCNRYQELYEYILKSQQKDDTNSSEFLDKINELREIIIQAIKYTTFLAKNHGQSDEDTLTLYAVINSSSLLGRMILDKFERFKVRDILFRSSK